MRCQICFSSAPREAMPMVWARSQYSGSANIGTWPTSSGASHSQHGSLPCRPHEMSDIISRRAVAGMAGSDAASAGAGSPPCDKPTSCSWCHGRAVLQCCMMTACRATPLLVVWHHCTPKENCHPERLCSQNWCCFDDERAAMPSSMLWSNGRFKSKAVQGHW